MSGPGIRYWNMARVLARTHHVTLAIPNTLDNGLPKDGARLISVTDMYSTRPAAQRLEGLICEHDVIISQYLPFRYLSRRLLERRFLLFDLYSPWTLENLEYALIDPAAGNSRRGDDQYVLNQILALGDFFVCANERQRDYWLGALSASGRVLDGYYQADQRLFSLIDIVPFGLPDSPPQHRARAVRGELPRVLKADCVVLWGGGIWNWMDPLTGILAMDRVARRRSDVKLIFLGCTGHDPDQPAMSIASRAIAMSEEYGLKDRYVFFLGWVPYSLHADYLLEADIGLSLHRATYESRLSFRTRILDYLWASLPVVATQGDVLGDLILERKAGCVVPPEDSVALADAIDLLASKPDLREWYGANASTVAREFSWERVMGPVLRYCRSPYSHRGGGARTWSG